MKGAIFKVGIIFLFSMGLIVMSVYAQTPLKDKEQGSKIPVLKGEFTRVDQTKTTQKAERWKTVLPKTDFNDDGSIDMKDVSFLFDNMENVPVEQADLNGNGRVDFNDIRLAYQAINRGLKTLDYDGNKKLNMNDVEYMFNNMDQLSVKKADLNDNDRVDFADIVIAFGLIGGEQGQKAEAYNITVGGGGLEYRIKGDDKTITTVAVGMGLHTSPYTLDLATGDISYIPYPNSWDDEDKRVTVNKTTDPVRYADILGIMKNTVSSALAHPDAVNLSAAEKSFLSNTLAALEKFQL